MKKSLLIALMSIFQTAALFPDSVAGELYGDTRSDGPRVGLVLSGGGAKGLTHISLLKILEEVNMPIDFIGGTSMGSIVGALYSIGYSATEIEQLVLSEDWLRLFSDEIQRRYLPMEEKRWDARYMLELPVINGKIGLPRGLVEGQEISKLFSRLTVPVQGITDFNRLPIPFVAIATDLETGEAIVIREGHVAEAIRASMSIPTVFTPARLGDKLAIDGGVSRNFPVTDVLEMGADFIIGVNVSTGSNPGDTLTTILNVLSRTVFFNILNTTENQARLADFLIHPDFSVDILGFDNVEEIIRVGDEVMAEFRPALASIADSINALRTDRGLRHRYIPDRPERIQVDAIRYDNIHLTDRRVLDVELSLRAGSILTISEIEDAIDRVYSLPYFDKVTWHFELDGAHRTLVIHFEEKDQDSVHVGLRYDNRTRSSILLGATFKNRYRRTSTWRMDLKLGEEPLLNGQFFYYLGLRPKYGVNIEAGLGRNKDDIYSGKDVITGVETEHAYGEFWIGPIFSSVLIVGGGLRQEFYRVSRQVGVQSFDTDLRNIHGLFGLIWLDTRNKAVFATRGQSFRGDYFQGFAGFGDYTIYNSYSVKWSTYLPVTDNFTLVPTIYSAFTTGDVPVHKRLTLGGYGDFSGFHRKELTHEWVKSAQLLGQIRVNDSRYVLMRANAGRVAPWADLNLENHPLYIGWSAAYGIDSFIGPVEFGLSGSKRHPVLFDIQIGYRF